MSKHILADARFEAVTEVAHGRQILKLALISHHLPVVAATYSHQGSRLHHENIAHLPESELQSCLTAMDHQAALSETATLQALQEF
jgi:hypothetical protein